MNQNKKLIVFDWNGTLIADTMQTWIAGNKCLEFYGAPPITLKQYRDTFTFPVIHFYKKNNLDIDLVLEKKTEANKIFRDHYEALIKNGRTRTGTRALLEHINKNGSDCIILSNHITERIEEQLDRLKIAHYFDYVSAHNCDGTTILQSTTKTERLSAYMEEQGYRPENTTIIGDSLEEPAIARQLGLTCISITDGHISRTRLKKAQPDYIVNSLAQIPEILKNI